VRLAYVTLCSLSRRFRGRRAAALVLTGPARLDGQIANGEPLTSG
jgi:hypothetical protein